MPLNPWLDEKLKKVNSPRTLDVLVEAEPGALDDVLGALKGINISVSPARISWGRFIPATIPLDIVEKVSRIPGVKLVHYNAPVYIRPFPFPLPARIDPLLGRIQLSPIEFPTFRTAMQSSPLGQLAALLRIQQPGMEIIPTSKIREMLGLPEDNKIGLTVAVIDTGITPHPVFGGPFAKDILALSTTGEPPLDGLGHGEWVASAAWGGSMPTRFGTIRGMAESDRSKGGKIISVKALSNIGFGTNESVLKAMEIAVKQGAAIVNMSLGGPLQGSVDEDPQCQIIQETGDRVLWCIAAGNDGVGEDKKGWNIGSPGASPKAVTFGAWSPKWDDVAIFSSRGPSGPFYKDHPDIWARDRKKYGLDLEKPDVCCMGGGPSKEGDITDEIYSAVTGWTDFIGDLTIEGTGAMRGTSMSTPIGAGLISLAMDKGLVKTAADVKAKMSRSGAKDVAKGYGLLTWERLAK